LKKAHFDQIELKSNKHKTAQKRMGAMNSSSNTYNLELQTLLHHSYVPEFGYYLHIKPHMTWAEFIRLLGPTGAEWADCTQCRRTWEIISTLSDTKGQPVIFRDSMIVYPEYAHEAITKFKESFRSTEYTDNMCFYPAAKSFNDGMNFGRDYTNGHVHIFLESNLPELTDDQRESVWEHQRMVKMVLPQFEQMSSKWSPAFFKKASQSNYGRYTDVIKSFCTRMISNMDIVKVSPRMMRPLLIQEINTFCSMYEDTEDWQDAIRQLVKMFRRRSCIDYTPRELIFRNFILNSETDNRSYEWPVKSSYAERIVAIGLHNALFTSKDTAVSCMMMGVSLIPPAQSQNIGYEAEVTPQYRQYALGKALRAYLDGSPIMLGTNQHRLQVLFYNITGVWQSMPGLSTVESCSVLFMDRSDDFLGFSMENEILAGFMGAKMGKSTDETLYNALVAFTSCPEQKKQ
jgi:hypothetical protein